MAKAAVKKPVKKLSKAEMAKAQPAKRADVPLEGAVTVAVSQLKPSPFQYRKTLPDLTEMVAAIKRNGSVDSPILVRRTKGGMEVVYGHCRLEATKRAGKPNIPAVIKEMTDEEVREAQFRENGQRANVHPMEEAEGYESYLKAANLTIEQLAGKVQKPVSHVTQRLQLLKLSPAARKAYYAGDIPTVDHANILARLSSHVVQDEALAALKEAEWSVNQFRERMREQYTYSLALAQFNTADTTYKVRDACTTCPKRTGANRGLFADIAEKDVCTDGACFSKKQHEEWERVKTNAQRTGIQVMSPEWAEEHITANGTRHSSTHVALEQVDYSIDPQSTIGAVLTKHKLSPSTAAVAFAAGRIFHLITKETYASLLEKAGLRKNGVGGSVDRSKSKTDRTAAVERRVRKGLFEQVVPDIVRRGAQLPDADVMQAVVADMLSHGMDKALLIRHGYGEEFVLAALEKSSGDDKETQKDKEKRELQVSLDAVYDAEQEKKLSLDAWLFDLNNTQMRGLVIDLLLHRDSAPVFSGFPKSLQVMAEKTKTPLYAMYADALAAVRAKADKKVKARAKEAAAQ